jgi:hypothetical protein
VSDGADLVFMCDYCREYVPVSKAVEFFVPHRELADGRVLVTTGTYCGRHCGEKATSWRAVG